MPKKHVVTQGECISSIAAAHKFRSWRTIYDDDLNADLRAKRPNPNLLHPGDEVMIPDREAKREEGDTGKRHTFYTKRSKTRLRLRLEVDEPLAYELTLGDEKVTGTTDGKAPIEHEIPPDLATAALVVWPDTPGNTDRSGAFEWTIQLGYLDPIEETSGVQGRLHNLGYYWGAIDGEKSAKTDEAVRRYQISEGLSETGTFDDATKKRLLQRHDEG